MLERFAASILQAGHVLAYGELVQADSSVAADFGTEGELAVCGVEFDGTVCRGVHMERTLFKLHEGAARNIDTGNLCDELGAFGCSHDGAAADGAHVDDAEVVHVALYELSVTRAAELVHIVVNAFEGLALVGAAVDADRVARFCGTPDKDGFVIGAFFCLADTHGDCGRSAFAVVPALAAVFGVGKSVFAKALGEPDLCLVHRNPQVLSSGRC